MPPYVAQYWLAFRSWLGIAPDSSRPNWGAFMLMLAIVLIAMKWTPVAAVEGAPWYEFYIANGEAMLAAAVAMLSRFENLLGIVIGIFGLRQMQAPSTSAPSFTVAVGESLKKIETISNGHAAAPAPPAGG